MQVATCLAAFCSDVINDRVPCQGAARNLAVAFPQAVPCPAGAQIPCLVAASQGVASPEASQEAGLWKGTQQAAEHGEDILRFAATALMATPKL